METEDGVTLGVKVTEPEGEAVRDVLLLHAMMVDARSMDRPPGRGLASTLAAQGFRVHRADFRGRGMSKGPDDWSYDDLVYRDVAALTAALDRPWVVGHSLGGHVTAASWATGSCAIAGLVGLAANVWMPSLEPSRRRRLAKGAGMALLRTSLRVFGNVAAKRVNMGPIDEAHGYGRDLLGYWQRDFWGDRAGRDWLAGLQSVEGPMLSVVSEGDALLAHPDGAAAWAAHVPQAEIWRVAAGVHGLPESPGHMELAIDDVSTPLWEAIGRWMRDRS